MNVKFQLAKAVFSALALVPLSISRGLGHLVGWLLGKTKDRNVRIIKANLTLCFPDKSEAEREQLLSERLQILGATALEMLKIWGASSKAVHGLVAEVDGRELLEEAIQQGRGTIILAPHLGNWEVIGPFLTQCASVVKIMYSRPKSDTMHQLIVDARQRTGVMLVPADRSGVVQLLKTLRAGDMIGILPDQVPADESGVFAPFFGQQALSMTLMSNLARKTGAAVITAYALPTPSGFKIVLSKPDPAIYAEDLNESVAAMNRTIEACVTQHPANYQWEYKRFKRRPEGLAELY
ncbi:MAG: lysophospholipid acyltransferase family protein [Pseudomonadales bacterium]